MMSDGQAMARLINALQPWRESIVLVGGWAHRLHRLHGDATVPQYQAVVTRDADLAFDVVGRMEGDIAKALELAGFAKRLSGEHVPPVSHFQLGDEDAGFYAEFLTPLRGSGIRRDGSDDATVAVAGVTAQKLRHLEVLLVAPWRLSLTPTEEFPVVHTTEIRVANPVSFITQKLLINRFSGARQSDRRSPPISEAPPSLKPRCSSQTSATRCARRLAFRLIARSIRESYDFVANWD